jgi:hypothetical protein
MYYPLPFRKYIFRTVMADFIGELKMATIPEFYFWSIYSFLG